MCAQSDPPNATLLQIGRACVRTAILLLLMMQAQTLATVCQTNTRTHRVFVSLALRTALLVILQGRVLSVPQHLLFKRLSVLVTPLTPTKPSLTANAPR